MHEDENSDSGMASSTLLSSPMSSNVTCTLSQIRGSSSWGWIFEPPRPHDNVYHSSSPYSNHHHQSNVFEDRSMYSSPLLCKEAYKPNTIERMEWFFQANQTRLLRDLLGVVDLQNINHENICCLNTAVVLSIFAFRRKQLAEVLDGLSFINKEEECFMSRSQRGSVIDHRNRNHHHHADKNDIVSNLHSLTIGIENAPSHNDTKNNGVEGRPLFLQNNRKNGKKSTERFYGPTSRNFRELLWFWTEYYTNRGRDRLSLEFSSHLRFEEWENIVKVLCADDGARTSL
eukprot:5460236-Ditylum_brightwellii.AAC.1